MLHWLAGRYTNMRPKKRVDGTADEPERKPQDSSSSSRSIAHNVNLELYWVNTLGEIPFTKGRSREMLRSKRVSF